MGASEAEIRETLGIDEKNQSRIRYAMRAANGPNACQ
jgi:ERCC4-type nuclease